MRRLVPAFAVSLALFVAFMPPGLCPCWLMLDPSHPHLDDRPKLPHPNGYLFDLFQTQALVVAPLAIAPISLLIAVQAGGGLWRRLLDLSPFAIGWAVAPPIPPPRP